MSICGYEQWNVPTLYAEAGVAMTASNKDLAQFCGADGILQTHTNLYGGSESLGKERYTLERREDVFASVCKRLCSQQQQET